MEITRLYDLLCLKIALVRSYKNYSEKDKLVKVYCKTLYDVFWSQRIHK